MLKTRVSRLFMVLLAAIAAVAPSFADDITFSGEVAYRERMLLPAAATLTITLVDLADGHPITAAHASLGDKAGSPIAFTLNVRSSVLAAGGDFALVAEIRHRGDRIFSTAQPVAVFAETPSGIVVPLIFSPSPAHPAPEPIVTPVEAPNPMLDVVWTVTSIGGDPVLPGSKATFSIAADHRAGGNGGCNNYFTEASMGEPALSFGPVAGTKMACDPAIMEQEARFFAALAATAGYEYLGNGLKLVDAAGVPLVGLVRQQ